MDSPLSFFDDAMNAIGAVSDLQHENEYKAHQNHLRKSLECVEEHGTADGSAKAESDFVTKKIDISQAPQITEAQLNDAIEICKVPEYIDHIPDPPFPGSKLQAVATILLWPSDLHEPNEGGQLAKTHYLQAFSPAYDDRVSQFDLRQQNPSNPLTSSGHYVPELWVDPSSLQAASPYERNQQHLHQDTRFDIQHGPDHDVGSGKATAGSVLSEHGDGGSSSGSSVGGVDSGSTTSSFGSSGTSSGACSSDGI